MDKLRTYFELCLHREPFETNGIDGSRSWEVYKKSLSSFFSHTRPLLLAYLFWLLGPILSQTSITQKRGQFQKVGRPRFFFGPISDIRARFPWRCHYHDQWGKKSYVMQFLPPLKSFLQYCQSWCEPNRSYFIELEFACIIWYWVFASVLLE